MSPLVHGVTAGAEAVTTRCHGPNRIGPNPVDSGGNCKEAEAFWLLQKGNVAKIQAFLGLQPCIMPLVWCQRGQMGSGDSLAHCFALQSWWEWPNLLVY